MRDHACLRIDMSEHQTYLVLLDSTSSILQCYEIRNLNHIHTFCCPDNDCGSESRSRGCGK